MISEILFIDSSDFLCAGLLLLSVSLILHFICCARDVYAPSPHEKGTHELIDRQIAQQKTRPSHDHKVWFLHSSASTILLT